MSACEDPDLDSDGRFLPSKLGTKEHWDTEYKRELHTFLEYGDPGEVWFGEESTARLLTWLQKQKVPLDASILDIGTGNGLLLVEMVADFLSAPEELLGFDLCVDKGTLDAISLDPNCAAKKRQEYLASLRRVLKDNGHFVITSCNWTREELICQFAEGFTFLEELPTPKFSFGGRTGSSVTALVFQKKH
ncbi:EEF1A lysine methyltransferase 2 isoform X3 [Pleurodeles waltl]|uniref:EEF1A lysine methyltransferase 2 isoform X3 n=1 Tax=Pleurodeles waltl TaxID=8319 RepID=UPI0037098846